MEKIAIIGGGASALMCACHIKNKDVTIFEMAEKFGKKILATGNGRCNLTNVNMNSCSYNQNVENYLKRFSCEDAISFFEGIGLETYADEEGRVYPISNTATSVLSVLKNYVEKQKNIKIQTNKQILDVFCEKNTYKVIFLDNSFEYFDKVVVASGNYTNLKIFDKFNVLYKNFTPSLCSLKTSKHKNLSGIRVDNVNVICRSANIDFEEIGEILFKDEGISGIVVFNLSARMARINNYCHSVYFDFLPNIDSKDVFKKLEKRKQMLGDLKVEEFLTGMFHKGLNYEILKRSNINLEKPVKQLGNEEIKQIVKNIKEFKLSTCGYYENNQVVSGGVVLDCLDIDLQCKNQKGLYFIGEVCDVDGACGGYNLQWAWTSGVIVGESL